MVAGPIDGTTSTPGEGAATDRDSSQSVGYSHLCLRYCAGIYFNPCCATESGSSGHRWFDLCCDPCGCPGRLPVFLGQTQIMLPLLTSSCAPAFQEHETTNTVRASSLLPHGFRTTSDHRTTRFPSTGSNPARKLLESAPAFPNQATSRGSVPAEVECGNTASGCYRNCISVWVASAESLDQSARSR